MPFNGKSIIPSGNNNWGQVNDPRSTRRWTRRNCSSAPEARAKAWAEIDRELVADAAAIPYDWDKAPNIEAKDVAGVGDLWNAGSVGLQLHLAEVGGGLMRGGPRDPAGLTAHRLTAGLRPRPGRRAATI